MSEAELVNQITTWLRAHKPANIPDDIAISEDTDLLGAGLLDSLGLVDLIMFMISLGFNIDLGSVDPAEFSMVKGLCRIALESQVGAQA